MRNSREVVDRFLKLRGGQMCFNDEVQPCRIPLEAVCKAHSFASLAQFGTHQCGAVMLVQKRLGPG